jgi:hypothetical protein
MKNFEETLHSRFWAFIFRGLFHPITYKNLISRPRSLQDQPRQIAGGLGALVGIFGEGLHDGG